MASCTIVASNRLQENLLKSDSCQFCHTDVTLDRVLSKRGLPVEEYKRYL